MSCTIEWAAYYGEIAVFAGGDAAAEIASAGTLTAAVAAAAVPEMLLVLAALASLIHCLESDAEEAQAAQEMQAKNQALQQEVDHLKSVIAGQGH